MFICLNLQGVCMCGQRVARIGNQPSREVAVCPVEEGSTSTVNNGTTTKIFSPAWLLIFSSILLVVSNKWTFLYPLFTISGYCNFQLSNCFFSKMTCVTAIRTVIFTHSDHHAQCAFACCQACLTEAYPTIGSYGWSLPVPA